ncbi:GntR family transcriptional regulator [Sphingobium sp. AR-3-1]|uniref:GntR family transcriptional regulator n=1 Tax=Sphingobium psychrophilum TaxID=2728834 RepID=A0A7X9WYL7_9SPHN|nr:GntR family transcriptional regulator [Sphingobium psychrophilum]NML12230.1 GntR family transcriptional regulator [Sphingobium psychrophilum]
MAIDRHNAVPLYHQIYLALRDEILSGQQPFGAILPTEHELGERFAVSRITARRALDELALEGFVERRRRTGTRVCFQTSAKPIEANIDQAVESLVAFGRNTRVEVVEITSETADIALAGRMRLPSGAALVRAVRIRWLDDMPLGEIVSYIPETLGRLATRDNLTAQPMLSLLRDAGVTIGAARQTIEAVLATPVLAQALAIEARAPLLRVERLVTDTSDQPVLLTIAHYRADRYRISLDLHETNRIEIGAG